MKAFAPLALAIASLDIISTLQAFHLLVLASPYYKFFMNFQPNRALKLYLDSFKLIFMRMSHLSRRGPSGMVFEHIWDVFYSKDFASDFIQLH
jgi:hypothetical protein